MLARSAQIRGHTRPDQPLDALSSSRLQVVDDEYLLPATAGAGAGAAAGAKPDRFAADKVGQPVAKKLDRGRGRPPSKPAPQQLHPLLHLQQAQPPTPTMPHLFRLPLPGQTTTPLMEPLLHLQQQGLTQHGGDQRHELLLPIAAGFSSDKVRRLSRFDSAPIRHLLLCAGGDLE
jgi:hypothetical protein